MSTEADLAGVLTRAVDEVQVRPDLLPSVRRGGRRRLRRRRAGIVATCAVVGALASVVATTVLDTGPVPQSPVGQVAVGPQPPDLSALPDLQGLPDPRVDVILKGRGVERYDTRYVASDDVPKDHVITHEIRHEQLLLTYSSGGPAVPLSQLPAPAAELLEGNLLPDELVLVAETAAGTAYKTDAQLVGPCAAVDLAYRTFVDPEYHDECY